ncbi:hypothetical protein [Enterococcus sp. AZ126]|uniref:hypothetical protein n=1 Tax=Enterococcus sp. AZ126 TaxID=2774635 RepID=UPI003F2127C1
MKIEIMVLLTVASICASIYFGLVNYRRNQKSEDKKEAAEATGMLVDLRNINNGVTRIENDLKTIREENKESRERLIIVEQSTKQAHRRIDKIEGGEK